MEYEKQTAGADRPLSEGRRRHRRSKHPPRIRIPLDAILLAVSYLLVMPFWIAKGQPRLWRPYSSPAILLWLAFGFGAAGTVMLIAARKPLYYKRHFSSWSSVHLSGTYWRLFFISRIFVIGSVLLLLFLGWMLQSEPRL